jgi:hypothetical protein
MSRKKEAGPLARVGVPMHLGIAALWLGPRKAYYWWASENPRPSPDDVELWGPFDSAAEATEAGRIAIVGTSCNVISGGTWDPAWEKPQ